MTKKSVIFGDKGADMEKTCSRCVEDNTFLGQFLFSFDILSHKCTLLYTHKTLCVWWFFVRDIARRWRVVDDDDDDDVAHINFVFTIYNNNK